MAPSAAPYDPPSTPASPQVSSWVLAHREARAEHVCADRCREKNSMLWHQEIVEHTLIGWVQAKEAVYDEREETLLYT